MKTYKILMIFMSFLTLSNIDAQSKKWKDQKSIKDMCGCYEVDFNFTETFNYSKISTYQGSGIKQDKALEWVELVEDKDSKIVLQHLLIIKGISSAKIIKHWRQDWIYENTNFYMYNTDNNWKFVKKEKSEVEGQWTQNVYQVDDSPRYAGSATWVHVDGKSYWENKTDCPLPRREYTKRDDYNVLVRHNRHEIIENGWIHDQDNDKVIRKVGKEDILLAKEKGWNVYLRVDDSRCKAAQDWWVENWAMWKLVRHVWKKVYDRKKDVSLRLSVNDKGLHEYMFGLKPDTKGKKIKKIIFDFIK